MILVLLAAAAATAAPAAPDDSGEVVVTGARESTLDLKRLRRAQAAFIAGERQFAPGSHLVFELRPKDGVRREGMTLTLRSGDRAVPVPIAADGGFILPPPEPGGWELVHNRGRGRIAVRPLVLAPGGDEADRTLGHFRLQCRVSWEVVSGQASFVQRAGFATLGGCSSSRLHIYFGTPRPIATATLSVGQRQDALEVRPNRRAFRVPLGDRTLPNQARVQVAWQPG